METPFFDRPETHSVIDELQGLKSIVLYVGAGASIERTGLTWAALCAQLLHLDDETIDYPTKVKVVHAATNELAVSSAIAQWFQRTYGRVFRPHLSNAIRNVLYAPEKDVPTYFNERIVSLANQYIENDAKVAIVTPNYDGFLLEAVEALERKQWRRLHVAKFGVTATGLASPPGRRLSELRTALDEPKTLTVVHLHGFVGRKPAPREGGECFPVVSERDYARTRENSGAVLGTIFSDRDVVIVGSGLSDPPLTHALLQTNPANHPRKRFVVRALQSLDLVDLDGDARASVAQVEGERALHLGVRLISPDFFCQAPQILEETRAQVALAHAGKPVHYATPNAAHTYRQRLHQWSSEWREPEEGMALRQWQAHDFLRQSALPAIRTILKCASGEKLKIELWIRWDGDHRQLALWASSIVYMPDIETTHLEPISATSKFSWVRAFVDGAPTYGEADGSTTRWRSYLARPVRVHTPVRVRARAELLEVSIPVGAICVASTLPQRESKLRPESQRESGGLFTYLDSVGERLAEQTKAFYASEPLRSPGARPTA